MNKFKLFLYMARYYITELPLELIAYIKSDEFKREMAEDRKRIDEYWDEKTMFVHRRAVKWGTILGILLGMFIGASIVLMIYLVDIEGCSVLDAAIRLFTWK